MVSAACFWCERLSGPCEPWVLVVWPSIVCVVVVEECPGAGASFFDCRPQLPVRRPS